MAGRGEMSIVLQVIVFDTRELQARDGAVDMFLARVTELYRERGIPLDSTGLL